MTLTYQAEPFAPIADEFPPLFIAHWEEIANNRDKIILEPDWSRYMWLAQAGMLAVVTARDEGKLVGYYFGIVQPHLHYASSLTAFTDIYWLMPEHRRGWAGYRLLKTAIGFLRSIGVQRMFIVEKLAHPHAAVFKRLGFKPVETVYGQMLE